MFTAKFGENVHFFFFFTWKNMYDIKRESRHACWVSKPSLSPTVCFFIKHFLSRFQIPRPHLFYSSSFLAELQNLHFFFRRSRHPFSHLSWILNSISLCLSHTHFFFLRKITRIASDLKDSFYLFI